jgi:hypothetical protein
MRPPNRPWTAQTWIEGPLWPALDAADAQGADPLFVNVMGCARAFETDPAIMGASAHLLAVARAGRSGRARWWDGRARRRGGQLGREAKSAKSKPGATTQLTRTS